VLKTKHVFTLLELITISDIIWSRHF